MTPSPCPHCGAAARPGSQFCGQCGGYLKTSAAGPPGAAARSEGEPVERPAPRPGPRSASSREVPLQAVPGLGSSPKDPPGRMMASGSAGSRRGPWMFLALVLLTVSFVALVRMRQQCGRSFRCGVPAETRSFDRLDRKDSFRTDKALTSPAPDACYEPGHTIIVPDRAPSARRELNRPLTGPPSGQARPGRRDASRGADPHPPQMIELVEPD